MNNQRIEVIKKLNSIISNKKISEKIENEIFNYALNQCQKAGYIEDWNDNNFKSIYLHKVLSIYYNINPNSPIKNQNLLKKVKGGEISIENLIKMSPMELFPEHWDKLREKEKATDEFLYFRKPDTNTDEYKCGKCKQRKCSYYELQTRSADEPMTTFVNCLVCGNKWRY